MESSTHTKIKQLPLRPKLSSRLLPEKMHTGTAEQWKGLLGNLQGVRNEEINQSGIMEYLYEKSGSDEQIHWTKLAISIGRRNLRKCQPTLESYWNDSFRPSLDVMKVTDKLPKRIEPKAKRFVDKAMAYYWHPSMGYWIIQNNYEDIVTVAPNWIVLDPKGKLLNSCWFDSSLEAFDAMHQTIRNNLSDYSGNQPITYFDEYTLIGGRNYQEWFVCLPSWPLPYRDSHFDKAQLLIHIRTTERVEKNGKRILMVEEIQSPWHADIRKYGSTALVNEIIDDELVGEAPFSKEWHELAIKSVIWLAIDKGYSHIGFSTGKQQCDRWGRLDGLIKLYDSDIPKCLNKIANQFECSQSETTIPTRKREGRVRRTPEEEWVVVDADNTPLTPPVGSKDIALHYLKFRGSIVDEPIRLLSISTKLKRAMIVGKIPLFGW
jgi:hypothetical protein